MDNIDVEASEYLSHILGKFTFSELTQEERHAAFKLARTLTDRARIKDFISAAGESEVVKAGSPEAVAQTLAPLVERLKSIAYPARFASLFETRSQTDGTHGDA